MGFNEMLERLCKVEADRILVINMLKKMIESFNPDTLPADYRSLLEEARVTLQMVEGNNSIDGLEGIALEEDENG